MSPYEHLCNFTISFSKLLHHINFPRAHVICQEGASWILHISQRSLSYCDRKVKCLLHATYVTLKEFLANQPPCAMPSTFLCMFVAYLSTKACEIWSGLHLFLCWWICGSCGRFHRLMITFLFTLRFIPIGVTRADGDPQSELAELLHLALAS